MKTQAVGMEEEWNSIENYLEFPLVIIVALLYQGYVTVQFSYFQQETMHIK